MFGFSDEIIIVCRSAYPADSAGTTVSSFETRIGSQLQNRSSCCESQLKNRLSCNVMKRPGRFFLLTESASKKQDSTDNPPRLFSEIQYLPRGHGGSRESQRVVAIGHGDKCRIAEAPRSII